MLYIVEIRDKHGHTACKEYEGLSIREAFSMARSDLARYPELTINDVWQKGSSMQRITMLPNPLALCVTPLCSMSMTSTL